MDLDQPFPEGSCARPRDNAADLGEHQLFAKLMTLTGMAKAIGRRALSPASMADSRSPLARAADNSKTGSRGGRANCIASAHVFGEQNVDPSIAKGGFMWFDPSAYSSTAPGTFGNCGNGTVRGPGLRTVDMSLVKRFPITERQNLEFRGEFINLTNTPILNAPTHTVGSTLGVIQSSQGERNIQFGLKYNF
jgi:hypothetical protein